MYVLMQCVAEAVMEKGVRGLVEMVPGGGFLLDVAMDAARRLKERKREAELRKEVLELAGAAADEVKRAAQQVAREVAPDASIEDRLVLEMYLTQIPGAVRQSLKRPEDPSGRTVPATFGADAAGLLMAHLPQRAARFRPGAPLPGKPGWKLVELLGTGGFGEVWLAANPTLSALRGAVKFGRDPKARDRLLRHEGALVNRIMEQGRHAHVVPLLDAHLEGETPWLMYEFVPGGDLTDLILSWQALPPFARAARATVALRTLATAVGHFHRLAPPLVHRDLKPANILVERGTEPVLKIADFGIGGLAAETALERAATAGARPSVPLTGAYTPLYASPQQQSGTAPDPRDDIHALGVIGFQMLTGRLDATPGADYAKTLRKLAVPEPLIELLGDCAAHDPDHRPRDGAELAERLTKLSVPSPPVPNVLPDSGLECPKCATALRVPEGAAGRRIKCPACKHVMDPITPPVARPGPPPAPEGDNSQSDGETTPTGTFQSPGLGETDEDNPRPVAKSAARSGSRESEPRTRESPPRHAPPPRRARSRLPIFVQLGMLVVFFTCVALMVVFFWGVSKLPEMMRRTAPTPPTLPSPPQLPATAPPNFAGTDWKKPEFQTALAVPAGYRADRVWLSPDGKLVAATLRDPKKSQPPRVAIWRIDDGTQLTTIENVPDVDASAVAFTPDSERFIMFRDVYSAKTGTRLAQLGVADDVTTTALSPDGKWLLAAGGNLSALRLDESAMEPIPVKSASGAPCEDVFPEGVRGRIVFDPTGTVFAVTGRTGSKTLLGKTDGWTVIHELGTTEDVFCAFTTTGDRIATWDGRTAIEWETKTGRSINKYATRSGTPLQFVLAADNQRLLTLSTTQAQVWGVKTPMLPPTQVAGHSAPIVRAAFNPSGSVLATADSSGTIRVREMTFPNAVGDPATGHTGAITDLRFSPDGDRLIACGENGVYVWHVSNPRRWW